MKKMSNVLKNVTLVTQMGISLIMPTLICVLFCAWLTGKKGVGTWVYIPGFILGLGSSALTGYKTFKAVTREEEKKEKSVGYNSHE